MQTNQATTDVLTYYRNGQHISIEDEQIQHLGGDLVVRKIVTEDEPQHGYDLKAEYKSLLSHPEGFPIPNAGCLAALTYKARECGCQLRGISLSPAIIELPAPQHLGELEYPALASFTQQHHRGLIRIPKKMGEAQVIAELAVAYPRARILVLGSQVASLERICHKLKCLLPADVNATEVRLVHSRRRLRLDDDSPIARICFSTHLEAAELDLATCDLVVLADAYECIHVRAQQTLEERDAQFRLFGIMRANRSPSPYESDVISATFGFEILDLMSHGRVGRDVQVAWVRLGGQPSLAREASFDYRLQYTHNHRRNSIVVQLARSLADGRAVQREKARDISRWGSNHGHGPHAVTILVDRLDHAIALGRKLDDWPIIAGKDCNLRGLSVSIRRRVARDPQQWLDGSHQIVLTDAAKTFPGYHSDIVLWAGGGVGGGAIPNCWLFSRNDPRRPMLIVDFLDHSSQQAREWSRLRRKDYERRDIFRVGVSAAVGRVCQFLHKHKERSGCQAVV